MTLDEAGVVRWGHRLGETLASPVVLGLVGELGAGKSVLARAIGRGAGVEAPMPSPSFNLVFRYPAARGLDVVHLDLYRLSAPDELWELGWAELGAKNEIVLVEWPERAGHLMPPDHWLIRLDASPGGVGRREIEVERVGTPAELAPFPMTVSES